MRRGVLKFKRKPPARHKKRRVFDLYLRYPLAIVPLRMCRSSQTTSSLA
jgi:hypothetical protein